MADSDKIKFKENSLDDNDSPRADTEGEAEVNEIEVNINLLSYILSTYLNFRWLIQTKSNPRRIH